MAAGAPLKTYTSLPPNGTATDVDFLLREGSFLKSLKVGG